MPIELDEEDGYIEVRVKPRPGDSPVEPVWLDAWEANNVYAVLCDRHPPEDDPAPLAKAWQEHLTTCGLPELSHANLFLLARRCAEKVDEVKKKHGLEEPSPTPDSSASTESPSAERPAAG